MEMEMGDGRWPPIPSIQFNSIQFNSGNELASANIPTHQGRKGVPRCTHEAIPTVVDPPSPRFSWRLYYCSGSLVYTTICRRRRRSRLPRRSGWHLVVVVVVVLVRLLFRFVSFTARLRDAGYLPTYHHSTE